MIAGEAQPTSIAYSVPKYFDPLQNAAQYAAVMTLLFVDFPVRVRAAGESTKQPAGAYVAVGYS